MTQNDSGGPSHFGIFGKALELGMEGKKWAYNHLKNLMFSL